MNVVLGTMILLDIIIREIHLNMFYINNSPLTEVGHYNKLYIVTHYSLLYYVS